MLFMRTKIGWRIAGKVSKVKSVGYYPNIPDQKYAELLVKKMSHQCYSIGFNNKNSVIDYLGFRPLNENERMHGLIPLYRK